MANTYGQPGRCLCSTVQQLLIHSHHSVVLSQSSNQQSTMKSLGVLTVSLCIFLSIYCSSASPITTSAAGAVQSRVINSSTSVFAPYYARLTAYTYTPSHSLLSYGSGTFITGRHIVTSATFVINVSQVTIQYGASKLAEMAEKTLYPDIISHPEFNAVTYANDIAIIVLPTPIDHREFLEVVTERERDSGWLDNNRATLSSIVCVIALQHLCRQLP